MTDWNLLAKYLEEQCSSAEADAVRRWRAADPANAAELDLLRRAWRRAAELPSAPRVEALWERIAQSAELAAAAGSGANRGAGWEAGVPGVVTPQRGSPRDPSRERRRVSPRSAMRRWSWSSLAAGAAAAVTLLAVAAPALLRHRAARPGRAVVAAPEATVRDYRTTRGQRATITLLDGTRVALGVDSRLRVAIPTVPGSGERVAMLEGEALFEVAHLAGEPFVVHAGGAVARDIGTTFDVRAYADEPVRVVVVAGSVAVRDASADAGQALELGANDLARLQTGMLEVERGIDPRPFVAWTDGSLVFRQARLAAVAAQLERVYDVRIVIADPALRDARVSASFSEREGIDSVLRALTQTLDAAVVRRGQTITMRPGR